MKLAFDGFHSSVKFTIRQMMSKVRGQMKIKEGWIEVDNDNLSKAKGGVVLDAASIDTGVEMRDNHLRSADGHFDVANYPTITFTSKRIEGTDPSNFRVIGDVTIHGITKEVVLDASFNGEGKDPLGNRRLSFDAQTKLNRHDYDLTWNQALEAGGFILGGEAKLEMGGQGAPARTPAGGERDMEGGRPRQS